MSNEMKSPFRVLETEEELRQKEEALRRGDLYTENWLKDPDDFSNREYLILYIGTDENGDEFSGFKFEIGRLAAFSWVKLALDWIDLNSSQILAGPATLNERISLYDFMIKMKIEFEDDTLDLSSWEDASE